jgi:hypothetical protein
VSRLRQSDCFPLAPAQIHGTVHSPTVPHAACTLCLVLPERLQVDFYARARVAGIVATNQSTCCLGGIIGPWSLLGPCGLPQASVLQVVLVAQISSMVNVPVLQAQRGPRNRGAAMMAVSFATGLISLGAKPLSLAIHGANSGKKNPLAWR